jgi:hypothetical protein
MTLPLVGPLLDNTILILIPVSKTEEGNYESYNLQGVYLCTLSFCCCWDRGWGALTHLYFLTSLKMRFFCFMITSVPFSMIISVIKWSSVNIYVWSAFFHFRQYSYHVTRFVIFFSGAYITHWLKRFTFQFYSYLKLPLNRPLDTKWIGRA